MESNQKISIAILQKSSAYKVLGASGTAGDVLKAHQVNSDALLLVRTGCISYQTSAKEIILETGEVHNIPSKEIHEVHCKTDAHFFLVVPTNSKMKFEK